METVIGQFVIVLLINEHEHHSLKKNFQTLNIIIIRWKTRWMAEAACRSDGGSYCLMWSRTSGATNSKASLVKESS